LKGQSDSDAFYTKIKHPDPLRIYSNLVDNDDINVRDAEDLEPLNTEDFWTRDKSSFVYTAKILPEIRDRYPEAYEEVFDGEHLLPAGVGGENPKENTIWNAVVKAEGGNEEEDTTPASSSSDEDDDDFDTGEEEEEQTREVPSKKQIKKTLDTLSKKSGGEEFSEKQTTAVQKFLKNILSKL